VATAAVATGVTVQQQAADAASVNIHRNEQNGIEKFQSSSPRSGEKANSIVVHDHLRNVFKE
jgi:hypothetical protein